MASNDVSNEILLYVWPSDFGLASVDVNCLQAMVASKISAAPVKFISSVNHGISSSGTFPFLVHNDVKLTDFGKIAEYLRNTKLDIVLDGDLTPSQRSEFVVYSSYLRSRLLPAIYHLLWADRSNYSAVTHQWYSSHMTFPWNMFYLEKRRKQAQKYLQAIGKNENVIIKDCLRTLNALSAKLGDNKYFCGDKPCSLDALIFGYLAPLLKLPLPSDRVQLHLQSLPNLARFVESIICIYLPLSEEQIRQQSYDKKFWDKRKSRAQKEAEENKLRKQLKKTEADKAGSGSMRDTIIFATGALTLSVLFAIHTGIISFVREGDILETE